MTTYIPALTIPQAVFLNPAVSILLPISLGTAVGYSTRREYPTSSSVNSANLKRRRSDGYPEDVSRFEAASSASSTMGIWTCVDGTLRVTPKCLPLTTIH